MRKKWGEEKVFTYTIFMENLNYRVTDLTLTEQKEVNGGIFWEALVIAVVVAVIDDWDNFKRGISGKPEIAKQ